ncbi:MAG: hypothetical protein KC516_01865 [Nanoarchaeota archaeon]|nr:hypothetical protein [Nanoarchaeota archaeon]
MKSEINLSIKTPVLFLVFNRLDTTKKVFEEIKKARPRVLFIAADGPRNESERKKTDQVRDYILKNVDWNCRLKTLFRERNLGCKIAVSSAIDWFFNNVERGIILEDDCLPQQSFFKYCEEILEKFKDNEKIMHIAGTNVEGISEIPESYFFSRHFNVWGWASWKRAWEKYDVNIKIWPKVRKERLIRKYSRNYLDYLENVRGLNNLYKGKLDTWDYQWAFTCIINNGFAVHPRKNQITNIGFTEQGTHTNKSDKRKILKSYPLEFPLEDNSLINNSKRYEEYAAKFFHQGRILKKIKKILRI